MRILILGGSNTGVKDGWTNALRKICPEHHIDNRFLGAVGSLYGLLRLLKMRRDGEPKPDLVIFEYTLNDSIWLAGQAATVQLIVETLNDVATYCARENIRLLFLCLRVRPVEGEGASPGSLYMEEIYRHIAQSRGVADCIFLADVLGEIRQDQYVDAFHLAKEPCERVAETIAARLREPVPIPRGRWRRTSFFYVDASEARTKGPSRQTYLTSSVFDGPFIELARGGASYWPSKGRLVALMVRSTELSGYYRIRGRDRAIRKNAQSLARENVPKLMTLHYVTGQPEVGRETIIDLPTVEDELMELPNDLTLMDCPSPTPFASQQLEVNGAIFYHRPSRTGLVIDAILSPFDASRFWSTFVKAARIVTRGDIRCSSS